MRSGNGGNLFPEEHSCCNPTARPLRSKTTSFIHGTLNKYEIFLTMDLALKCPVTHLRNFPRDLLQRVHVNSTVTKRYLNKAPVNVVRTRHLSICRVKASADHSPSSFLT